jgi:hypothetical protein
MKKKKQSPAIKGFVESIGVFAAMVALTSSANAAASDCKPIADPMKRLACYDSAANVGTPKTAAIRPAPSAAYNAAPANIPVKALGPIVTGPRYWIEAEGGIYGFSRNLPVIASIAPPATTGPTFIPTSPGFIGLFTTSTVNDPLVTGTPATVGGGGSYRMGYWLDPARTMAVEGSAFFVQGQSKFDLSGTPTIARTSTFVNTTPDVFVGLFDDTTTTTVAGGIRERLYGADANFRMKAPYFGSLSNFDVMVGMRYVGLEEKLTASVNSSLSRTYQPALGIPPPTDFTSTTSGFDSFTIRNNFVGPQVGFSAEQHWGRFWVANENKLAVGAMIEQVLISGSTVFSAAQGHTIFLAGIPLIIATGAPNVTSSAGVPVSFGLFGQGERNKTVFAVVPNGSIKAGYDVTDTMSLTVAYNYLYMSQVGRVADQVASPTDIRQSGLFAQGITFGAKVKF